MKRTTGKRHILAAVVGVLALLAVVGLFGCSQGAGNSAANNAESNATADSQASSSSSSANANTNANSEKQNSETYTLIVGYDPSRSPFSFLNADGQLVGLDVDLAAVVCRLQGWHLELRAIDWDEKEALLSTGVITCVWSGLSVEDGGSHYAFSDSYLVDQQVIVAKKGVMQNEKSLAGATVVVPTGSDALTVLDGDCAKLTATFGTLRPVVDSDTAFAQLDAGEADAVACDLVTAEVWMKAHPDTYETVTVLSAEHFAVGFKLGDEDKAKAVSESLARLTSDGTAKQLCEKYADFEVLSENWAL